MRGPIIELEPRRAELVGVKVKERRPRMARAEVRRASNIGSSDSSARRCFERSVFKRLPVIPLFAHPPRIACLSRFFTILRTATRLISTNFKIASNLR